LTALAFCHAWWWILVSLNAPDVNFDSREEGLSLEGDYPVPLSCLSSDPFPMTEFQNPKQLPFDLITYSWFLTKYVNIVG
jgi:hypothetical protein